MLCIFNNMLQYHIIISLKNKRRLFYKQLASTVQQPMPIPYKLNPP